jgi:pimeloyl-ACP methyl ester carboxylesterase/UDP:flavonoid glycosyltransferase YjiC (YdhE family)
VRAREADESGYATTTDGLRLYWERHGSGAVTIVLLPANPISNSRLWKAQVHHLARHYRVILYDGRGNGKSDSPDPAGQWLGGWWAADCLSVMDATGTPSAVLAGICADGVWPSIQIAAAHPERVQAIVAIAAGVPLLSPPHEFRAEALRTFEDEPGCDPRGWQKFNRRYIEEDHAGFLEFFFGEMFPEPHSTKQIEDAVEYGLEGSADVLLMDDAEPVAATKDEVQAICRRVHCPVLVVHGDRDNCQPISRSIALAELTGARFVRLNGSGHLPNARHPVVVNTLIREFVDSAVAPPAPHPSPWLFARERKRRVLWISSPIGLGHILRDLAISRALRRQVPGLEIHWWAQPPVTTVLEAEGEIVHPASEEMASESAHWESEATHHDLHAFYAFRRMDEIFCANYMLFDDVVRETPYDLWVGDESWEVDHFLHENPERKIAPYAFMTDVIGFLPVDPAGDPREADLCTDYNAEMIEHLARFPYVRDRSVFVGAFDELPDASFGPGLPRIREWSAQWFRPVPYVVPFDPAQYRRPRALRTRLGYGTGYPLYVAAVGGTAVGRDLLALIAEGFEIVRKEQPEARLVMVTGPRIAPSDLPDVEGMDKLGYVPSLFEHLACADVAIVQGGLSTTMELVAARRPFVYFPLAHHWEQQHFVAHRLDHYGAGVRMDYATTTPVDLAAAITAAAAKRPAYRAVRRDGAAQAAAHLADILSGGSRCTSASGRAV